MTSCQPDISKSPDDQKEKDFSRIWIYLYSRNDVSEEEIGAKIGLRSNVTYRGQDAINERRRARWERENSVRSVFCIQSDRSISEVASAVEHQNWIVEHVSANTAKIKEFLDRNGNWGVIYIYGITYRDQIRIPFTAPFLSFVLSSGLLLEAKFETYGFDEGPDCS